MMSCPRVWINSRSNFLTWKSVNSSSTKGTWWWVLLVHSVFSLESMKLCKRLKMVLYIFKKVSLMSTNWDWWFKSWPSCRVRIQIGLSVSCICYLPFHTAYLWTHLNSIALACNPTENSETESKATRHQVWLLLYWLDKSIRAVA